MTTGLVKTSRQIGQVSRDDISSVATEEGSGFPGFLEMDEDIFFDRLFIEGIFCLLGFTAPCVFS